MSTLYERVCGEGAVDIFYRSVLADGRVSCFLIRSVRRLLTCSSMEPVL